jgi:hypothetical protein
MATKSQARGTKKKAAKKPKMEAKEQSERFIETARELGVDESGGRFESAAKLILTTKRPRERENP